MEYIGYIISGIIAIVVGFLQNANNRKYNELKELREIINKHETKIAVNSTSDKKDSEAFEKHQKSMDGKFDELNRIISDFTTKVESEIKEIKSSVNKLEISVAKLTK